MGETKSWEKRKGGFVEQNEKARGTTRVASWEKRKDGLVEQTKRRGERTGGLLEKQNRGVLWNRRKGGENEWAGLWEKRKGGL